MCERLSMAANKSKSIIWGAVAVVAVVVAVVALLMPRGGAVTNVDSAGLRDALAKGATMLDVRTQGEYEAAHIPGAVLVDYATYEAGVAGLPKDKPYIVYCASGSRSPDLVNYMKGQGFEEIYHLNQGVVSWDGALVSGPEVGNVADALSGGQSGPSESMLASALQDPLVAPAGTPVMIEFRTDD